MSAYELAQLNIGIIKGPMDSTLRETFPAPDAPASSRCGSFEDECPAT